MSTTFNLTVALDIVANDDLARRLIATWPLLALPAAVTDEVVAEWSRISGIHQVNIRDRIVTLFAAGICQDAGLVPPEVLAAIRQLAVGKIRRDSRFNRGPRTGTPGQ